MRGRDGSGPFSGPDAASAASPVRPGPLCRRVADLCGIIGFREPHLNDQLKSLIRALDEPLRVAFAGRVSLGKSTLVNALLRAPVAPTGDRETTRVVTRFEAGDYENVELALRDGSRHQAFLTPDGVLPPGYPFAIEQLREVRVRLPYAPLLDRVTIVDTPGLESLNEEASNRTSESLFSRDSRDAIADADALVHLLRVDSEGDAAAVAAFNELTAVDLCALNAVGVLNCKVEGSVSDVDRIARRLKNVFRNRVADVIPVAGLLALTAGSALLNERDMGHLRSLASHDEEEFLIDVEYFLEAPGEVAPQDRQRLLDLLGFTGLRTALRTIRSVQGDVAQFSAALLAESGLPRLLAVIDGTFANCADQIKAGQTLVAVTRLSYQTDSDEGHRARVLIETLRADPAMHGIQELWALQRCGRQDLDLDEWIVTQLAMVARGATASAKLGLPDEASSQQIREAAQEGAARAHSYAASLSMTRPEARIAETLRRSYTNIWREAARESETPL
jgi:50S ribosome-binding GTPase